MDSYKPESPKPDNFNPETLDTLQGLRVEGWQDLQTTSRSS